MQSRKGQPSPAPGDRRMGTGAGGLWPRHFPVRAALVATLVLLSLAGGTTWLLQRDAARETQARRIARARSQAELIAQAAGQSELIAGTTGQAADPAETARLARLLECTIRDGDVSAAAIIDSSGRVIAHTDLALLNARVFLPPAADPQARSLTEAALAGIFPERGQLILHPLIGSRGSQGMAVLRLAEKPMRLIDPETWRVLLPAALLLLAFAGLTLAIVRWAVRPTAEFLDRLSRAFESENPPGQTGPSYGNANPALDQAVHCVNALQEEKHTLLIQNRVLNYEKKRLARIFDRLPVGILLADPSERIVLHNRAAAKWLDGRIEEGVEFHLDALEGPWGEAFSQARAAGQAEVATLGSEGRRLGLTRLPLAGPQGQAGGALYILRDDTAQHAARRAQAEFLSQITHELKAPLNTIVTFIEALTEDDQLPAEERQAYFNTLSDEAMRMGRLISNLMQLSRIQLGNLSADFGFVKPSALIAQQAETFRAQALARGQTLEVSVPENLPALHGDKDLLAVALTNLLSNAIKYTPAGGHIAVRAASEEDGICVEIEDNGIGIPPTEQERVFERFVRSSQPEVQAQTGSGLGLALVREIAEIHEGRITLSSEPGRGSHFRLWLPCRRVGNRMDVAAA
ncbi:MAG: ATP-binding protein [Candidatus Eisenbacteria bacterium]